MPNNTEIVVARKCYDCGATMEGRRENYRYTESGLASVILTDVLVFHCKCGTITPEIPAVGIIHQTIALDLLRKGSLLTGEEIRFLRKMAGYNASKLAAIMGVEKGTLSRWENDKQPIGKESDRLLRFACFDGIVRLEQAQSTLAFAKNVASFNLPDLVQHIEDHLCGSKPIRVNPELLSGFGGGTDTAPESPGGTILN